MATVSGSVMKETNLARCADPRPLQHHRLMTSSALVVCIVGTSPVRLWALEGGERLQRQLRALGIAHTISKGDEVPAGGSIVLLRADHLFDDRTLRDLVSHPGTVVLTAGPPEASTAVAAHVAVEMAPLARAVLEGKAAPQAIPGVTIGTPAALSSAYVGKLLKSAPPLVLPIRAAQAAALERYLFDGAYKGVTDLVTKWVWPAPARWATRWCARLGVGPNAVTATSLILAVAAMVFFARGQFGIGLLVAWVMTFLDTVDGKLARVTVTSTQFGHIFDHVIDLIHPPLWYLAWAYGVAGNTAQLWMLRSILVAIVVGYVAGRLIEGAFEYILAGFSLFTWQPLDSYVRLVTARRNPNLLLLSAFAFAGLPREGLIAVALWTVLSTVCLTIRLGQAVYVRVRSGHLQPWLGNLAADPTRVPSYARPFISTSATLQQLTQ